MHVVVLITAGLSMSVTLFNILNRFLFAPPAGPSSRASTSSFPVMLIPSGLADFINHHNTSENKRELVSGFY